jgi:mannosylglucosylglycerate synthase
MMDQQIGVLHYSAPPVIGGVEAVIKAHLNEFLSAGYFCTVVAGRGQADALPEGANFIRLPEIDSQYPEIIKINHELESGRVPRSYADLETRLVETLDPILRQFDHLIVHNVFTKHFNLPLTGALVQLLEMDTIQNGIAWCHDFTWTSPSSRSKVHPGYPWDLLRTKHPHLAYVTVSRERQLALAELFACPFDQIELVYNGVDPNQTLGLSSQGLHLVNKLGLLNSDLNLLMPVRVTQAKNIEFALQVLVELKKLGIRPRLVVTGPPDPHDSKSMDYYQSLIELRQELGVAAEMHFVFESGPDPDQGFMIDEQVVGDLYRVSDMMFMPSHREGFGMPVLEAGLVGIPVVSRAVPAAQELAENEALIFSDDKEPREVAAALVDLLERSAAAHLRRRVRQHYTWQAIFEQAIRPLLHGK